LAEENRWGEAVASYQRALQHDPNMADAYNSLGCALQVLERYDEALGAYQRAKNLGSPYALGNYERLHKWLSIRRTWDRAMTALEREDFAAAATHFRELTRLDSKLYAAHLNLGWSLYRQALAVWAGNDARVRGFLEEALEAYRKAIKIDPKNPTGYHEVAGVLCFLGRHDEAVFFYQEALRRGGDRKRILKGLEADYLAHEDAVKYYRVAVEIDPGDSRLRQKLGNALNSLYWEARFRKDAPSGIKLAEELIELDPKDPSGYRFLGSALIEKGDLRGGKKAFGQATQLAPLSGDVHTELGWALLEAEDFKGAETAYRNALALVPATDPEERAAVQTLIGDVLGKQGKEDEAMEAYREALRTDPYSSVSHSSIGRLLLKRGAFREAAEALEKALALDPQEESLGPELVDLYTRWGMMFTEAGNLPAARHCFDTALEIDPSKKDLKAMKHTIGASLEQDKQRQEAEKSAAREEALEEMEGEVHLVVHGQSVPFSVWKHKPEEGKGGTGPREQLKSADRSGTWAKSGETTEKARSRSQMAFDTAGLSASPLEAVGIEGKGPRQETPLPEVIREDPRVSYLLEKREQVQRQIEGTERRLQEIIHKEADTPGKKVRIAREREKIDKAKQTKVFLDFAIDLEVEKIEAEEQSETGGVRGDKQSKE
jgi:superkiller protein 3